jgi:hypothetical protein
VPNGKRPIHVTRKAVWLSLSAAALLGILAGGLTTAYTGAGGAGGKKAASLTAANLWVDTNGGTCTRQATPGAYVDAQACSSLPAAYTAATAGDIVLVKCGSYGDQNFTTNKAAGASIVFRPETDFCATFDNSGSPATIQLGAGGSSYLTIEYFNINGGGYPSIQKTNVTDSTSATNVSFLHNHVNVDKSVHDAMMNVGGDAVGWTFQYNTFGPACCGDQSGTGIEVRFTGIAGGNEVKNLTFSNNLIQSVSRFCNTWPSTYVTVESPTAQPAGSCPDANGDCAACHMDAIHIYGLQNATIAGNRIYNVACQGIFVEDTGSAVNGPMTIVNNAITTNSDNCNSGITVEPRAGTHSIKGAWTIAFNTANTPIHINIGAGGTASQTSFNLVGNLAPIWPDGSNTGCTSWDSGTATATWSYNAVETYGGSQNSTCGTGDVYPVSPTFANSTFDLHLAGAMTAADNLVPSNICTAIATFDFDGDARPFGTACEAGADERGGSPPPPPPGSTLGYTTVGGSTDFAPTGYLDVNGGFALASISTITDGKAYLDGGTAAGQLREVVYADAAGKPAATPVAVSTETVEPAGAAAGWATFAFRGETLPAGTYWIGFWIGGWTAAAHGHFYYDTVGSATSSYYEGGHPYSATGNPPASTWGSHIDERVSAYLDLAAPSPPSPPVLNADTIAWNTVTGATSYNLYADGVKVSSTVSGRSAVFAVTAGSHVLGVSSVSGAGESAITTVHIP